jgi:hypothetical protein
MVEVGTGWLFTRRDAPLEMLPDLAGRVSCEMPNISDFLITQRWPTRHPDHLQLYSLPTLNGVKVSIMLEEIGLPYEVHLVDFNKGEQHTPEFLSLNPNGKQPDRVL